MATRFFVLLDGIPQGTNNNTLDGAIIRGAWVAKKARRGVDIVEGEPLVDGGVLYFPAEYVAVARLDEMGAQVPLEDQDSINASFRRLVESDPTLRELFAR